MGNQTINERLNKGGLHKNENNGMSDRRLSDFNKILSIIEHPSFKASAFESEEVPAVIDLTDDARANDEFIYEDLVAHLPELEAKLGRPAVHAVAKVCDAPELISV